MVLVEEDYGKIQLNGLVWQGKTLKQDARQKSKEEMDKKQEARVKLLRSGGRIRTYFIRPGYSLGSFQFLICGFFKLRTRFVEMKGGSKIGLPCSGNINGCLIL